MRVELARLDLQIEHPPDDPLVYGDVVVIHPNVSSHQSRAARRDGGAAMIAEAGKRRRYPADRLSRGRLVPLAFEAHGQVGPEAFALLKTAARRAGQRALETRSLGKHATSVTMSYWATRISCALQKAQTRQLLNSVGDIYDSPLTCSRSSPSIWNLPDDNVIDTLQAELHVAELQLQAETIRQETAQAHGEE